MTALLVVLALMFAWGAVSPRSQWWALSGWALRRPEANEPSDAAYAVHRVCSILMIAFIAWLAFWSLRSTQDEAERTRSAAAQERSAEMARGLWARDSGYQPQPGSRGVSLYSVPVVASAPSGQSTTLVPLVGYTAVKGSARRPAYLWSLDDDAADAPAPSEDLVVGHDTVCGAHSLVVSESDREIRIGLYVEAPDSATGMDEGSREFCASTPGYGTELLPVDLRAPVGSRDVVDLATGEPLEHVG